MELLQREIKLSNKIFSVKVVMFRSESSYVESKECSLTTSYCASLERWQNLLLFFTLSLVWLFAIPWTVACQAPPSSTITWSWLKFMSIGLVMLSNHLSLCSPLIFLPSIFPSIRVFSKESALSIRWLKYWSLSFKISASNKHTGLISFRMDWLGLPAV